MAQQYLSELISDEDILQARPGRFNVIKANPGSGKTTFMFQDKILDKFARDHKHVLYLIHNNATRDFIANRHSDKAVVYTDSPLDGWFAHRDNAGTWGVQDDNHVHVMCYQTFAALIRNKGINWLDDIDFIIWDEFDDIRGFYKSETKHLQKILKKATQEELHSLLERFDDTSLAHFISELKTHVLDPARIVLIAISATPEIAAVLFQDYLNRIIFGGEQIKYEAKETIWFKQLLEMIRNGELLPEPGRVCWCYVTYIWQEQLVYKETTKVGWNSLMLWSESNEQHKDEWSRIQQRWSDSLKNNEPLPNDGHNFIIVNGAFCRGIDVIDPRITDWIFAGDSYEELVQFMRARYNPERQYLPLKLKGLIQFIQNGIPAIYYDWHIIDELKQLLEEQPIFRDWREEEAKGIKWEGKPFETWNAARKYYEERGQIESRQFGRARVRQYRFKPTQD